MKVRLRWQGRSLVLESLRANITAEYRLERWPEGLNPNDMLHALCGAPDDGWYPYNEIDLRWLIQCLRIASEFNDETIGGMAISDPLNLRRTPEPLSLVTFGDIEPTPSQMAASGLAVHLISRAFEASREEAMEVIRMNLFSEPIPVEG